MTKGKDHVAISTIVLNKMRKWFVGSCVQGGLWVRRVKAKFEKRLQKMAKSWAQKTSHQEDPCGFRTASHDLSKGQWLDHLKSVVPSTGNVQRTGWFWGEFLFASWGQTSWWVCPISAVGHLCTAACCCKQCTTGREEARPIAHVPGMLPLFLHKLGTRKLKCPCLLPPSSDLHLLH